MKRHPLRQALDAGDLTVILEVAKASSRVTEKGCWEWQFAKSAAGYGMMGQGGNAGLVHRRILAAVQGRDLGKESVHHICAVRSCINPDHLQRISHRENVAEMLERNFYIRRINDLEEALRSLDPGHPLVNAAGEYNLTSLTITGTSPA